VLIEKYVEKPRHIEVQVFGDNFGDAVHLFERDCSAQRRHQKVIEEAPAPGMTDELRDAMTSAAVKAAKATGYSGAGTIEFIVDSSDGLLPDRFWFMEMNTRLQVEHPVTEMITGIDLVEWQLRVAAGEKLPRVQSEIELSGHAFEARLYAEDATKGFLPATGTLHHLRFPASDDALRVETGVRAGDAISPYYDPMIAKLIVRGSDRPTALAALSEALESTEVAGSVTNLAFLAALGRDPDFATGDVDTGLIGRKPELTIISPPSGEIVCAALIEASSFGGGNLTNDPWSSLVGYTHFHPIARNTKIRYGDETISAQIATGPLGKPRVTIDGIELPQAAAQRIAQWPGHVTIFDGAVGYDFAIPDPLDRSDEAEAAGSMRAPMPGLVKIVRATAGETVRKGQPLLVLEAMKMEHTIAASHDGDIAEIAAEGSQVMEGAVLVRFVEAG
jgi:3-methylcrotonyl-CoA carboxylase alpha subunit